MRLTGGIRYIKVVKRATLIKEIAPLQAVWSMYYEFPTPGVSSRVFTTYQIAHLEESQQPLYLFFFGPCREFVVGSMFGRTIFLHQLADLATNHHLLPKATEHGSLESYSCCQF